MSLVNEFGVHNQALQECVSSGLLSTPARHWHLALALPGEKVPQVCPQMRFSEVLIGTKHGGTEDELESVVYGREYNRIPPDPKIEDPR